MADIVSAEKRSRMMSGIRGRDTGPELAIRRALHAKGFRFRLHSAKHPGKPDLAFARRNAVLFVNGCFWHGHDCHLFRLPGTRTGFWQEKIAGNVRRDREALDRLAVRGVRTGIVWECAMRGKTRIPFPALVSALSEWLEGSALHFEARGTA